MTLRRLDVAAALMGIVHLVVATPDLKRVVAIRGDEEWHVPRVETADNVSRLSLANQVRAKLDQIAPADLLHWAPLPLLRASHTAEQYCVAVARDASFTLTDCHGAVVVDPEELIADAILPEPERLAVQTALSRLEAPLALFDSRDELVEALAWGERQFVIATGHRVDAATRYRGQRHELVVRLQRGANVAYLKAGWERVHDEAVVTQYLSALSPHQFPETLAIDRQHHRWLYRELRGTPLSDSPLTQDIIVAAVRALAFLQMATIGMPAVAAHLAHRHRTAVGLFHAADDLVERAWQSVPRASAGALLFEGWKTTRNAMIRSCAAVDALEIPPALVPSDLSADNILVTPDGIGFIDLVNAYWSCPVLPLWRLVRDIEQRRPCEDLTERSLIRQVIVESFIDEWRKVVPPRAMLRAIAHLWLIGALFGILMASDGQDRYAKVLGMELPAGRRAAGLAARVRDLLRAVAMRAVVPRDPELDSASALDIP